MKKRTEKNEKPRLIKVMRIDCTNGNLIRLGQHKRKTETEPIVWEYEVISPSGKTLHNGECPDKHTAFMEALKLSNTK